MAAAGDKTSSQQQLRLYIHKRRMRLVYAECDRFMADVLFSFLTTPVGALVRRTGKSSGLGCMDSLYRSVEDMDAGHFETPECWELLLRPRSGFGFAHSRLKIGVNDVDESYYRCPSLECHRCSLFPGTKCECCGGDMTSKVPFLVIKAGDAVFVTRDAGSFVVTDDLFISPSSDALKLRLCNLAGLFEDGSNTCVLEEQIVPVDNDLIVQLMKSSLLSNTPLTDTFLPSNFVTKPIHWPLEFLQQHLIQTENSFLQIMNKLGKDLLRMVVPRQGRKKMVITLFHKEDRVIFALVEKEFTDLLFSFLTLPFGSIVTSLGRRSSLRCIDNLHQVVKRFQSDGLFTERDREPNRSANYLLNPPIALHHNCQNQLLKIGKQPFSMCLTDCASCHATGLKVWCKNSKHINFLLKTINPKYNGKQRTKKGGGYMRWPETFVVTNALVVKPINDLAESPFTADLEEKSVVVGRKEVLKILLASLVSEDPLTSVFLPADARYYWKKHV